MKTSKPAVRVNSNFHHCSGDDLFDKNDSRFREYRAKWKAYPETFTVGDFPLFIDIEVTSACNLKCPFCATTFRGREIKAGFISSDVVKRIVDEGSEKDLYGIKFNIRGEPLLHPKIHDFVKYAKDKKLIDVYFNTNALLLTDDVAHKLIDGGLDRLSVSIEGYTKDVYEKYRVGSSFEMIVKNIENMQALKKKLGVSHPKIRVQTVMLPEIKIIFEEYKKFWSNIADEVAYLDYKEMKTKKKGVQYPWACPQLWQRMAIWWDGTILPCNHDDDGLLNLGNVREVSIVDAWHSEKLAGIRKAHKENSAHNIPACDGCYLRDSEIEKLMNRGEEI